MSQNVIILFFPPLIRNYQLIAKFRSSNHHVSMITAGELLKFNWSTNLLFKLINSPKFETAQIASKFISITNTLTFILRRFMTSYSSFYSISWQVYGKCLTLRSACWRLFFITIFFSCKLNSFRQQLSLIESNSRRLLLRCTIHFGSIINY